MAAACVVVPLGPACVDLTGIRAGDRNYTEVTIKQKGQPVDLTGLTVTAQARKKPTDTTALNAVIDVLDAAGGLVSMRWPGQEVTDLLAGKATWDGVWDLQIQSPPDDALTVAAGGFHAVMDVTR